MGRRVSLPLLLSWTLWGCGGGVIQREGELPSPPPGRALLQLEIEPRDALVLIDDQPFAIPIRLRQGITTVSAGHHRVEIQRNGHLTWYGEVELTSQHKHRLRVQLLQIPKLQEE